MSPALRPVMATSHGCRLRGREPVLPFPSSPGPGAPKIPRLAHALPDGRVIATSRRRAVDKHSTGGPWVERIVWRTITEPGARVTALRTGDADLIATSRPRRSRL